MPRRLRYQTNTLMVALALLVAATTSPARAEDHQAPKSWRQVLYVPVYSAIFYFGTASALRSRSASTTPTTSEDYGLMEEVTTDSIGRAFEAA